MAFVLLGVSTLTFFVSHLMPADPARLAAGLYASTEQVERMRKLMGLDKPIFVQYGIYMRKLLGGDFGTSMHTHRPVVTDLKEFIPATVELAAVSIIVYSFFGILFGVLSAVYRGKVTDFALRLFVLTGMGMPAFWLGLVLQLVFYRWLDWLPAGSRLDISLNSPPPVTHLYLIDSLLVGDLQVFVSALRHLVLPVSALVLGRLANIARITRVGMIKVLEENYIRTAHAKGLRERTVILRHALKNALIPVITIIGLQFGYLLGGTVLIEVIFNWPGIGQYVINSISALDFPVLMSVTILAATVFVAVNLCVDVIYVWIDPRIRY